MTNLSKSKNRQPEVNWEEIHQVIEGYLNSTDGALDYHNVYYEYFQKYCTIYGTGFNFTDTYIEFRESRSYIDMVHDEASCFQQSTVQDFHDLTFSEIQSLKEIYIIKRGELSF